MFTVKKKEYKNKTFRIPDELLTELECVAQNEHISLNNLVVQCCRYALDNISEREGDKTSEHSLDTLPK